MTLRRHPPHTRHKANESRGNVKHPTKSKKKKIQQKLDATSNLFFLVSLISLLRGTLNKRRIVKVGRKRVCIQPHDAVHLLVVGSFCESPEITR